MGGNGKQIVVDTSVIMAWLLPDESVVKKIDLVFKDMVEGKLDFVGPELLKYEVWNALRNSTLRKRIDFQTADNLREKFENLNIRYCDAEIDGGEVMRISQKYGLTAYDAAYVSLAEKLRCDLLSLDRQMVKYGHAASGNI